MINQNLTKEEYDLIIQFRQSKYKLDITQEEYNLIVSKRDIEKKIYEKYIENIETLSKDRSVMVSNYASKLLGSSKKLKEGSMSLEEYGKLEDFPCPTTDEDAIFKIGCLNYIKESIFLNFPN